MRVVIVGSGPAAAAASLALQNRSDISITVLDLGSKLEAENEAARRRVAARAPDEWPESDLALITQPPPRAAFGKTPQKQVYSSDFSFANLGQLDGFSSRPPANEHVVSGAYGGFSNTWGAQMLAYSDGTFETWPIGRSELDPHYRSVLSQIPYAGGRDDLEDIFPLLGEPNALPSDAPVTERVMARYLERREHLRKLGVVLGRARLALNSPECRTCGLCMSGCPYELIYSASQTFDQLRASGRVNYIDDAFVYRVTEQADGRPTVHALRGREVMTIEADRIFLAAGSLGTTRIVAGSLPLLSTTISMEESAQFLAPFLSSHPINSLTQSGQFTLNQFNVLVTLDDTARNAALVHAYPYNDILGDAFPRMPFKVADQSLRRAVLRRLTVGLGYLPSWMSPQLQLNIGVRPSQYSLPEVRLDWAPRTGTKPFFQEILRRLHRAGPHLDLHPVPMGVRLSAAAKSYHYGGSFPHRTTSDDSFSSDLLGRVKPWRRIHLIDASVFPTIPATTITLTIMANAHRIATAVASES